MSYKTTHNNRPKTPKISEINLKHSILKTKWIYSETILRKQKMILFLIKQIIIGQDQTS